MAALTESSVSKKVSFREQMQKAREEAIVGVVNRLLAEKGFDAMTVDEVAAAVGIAKASLYRHFPSKEDLAAAAMVRVMRRALQFIERQSETADPLQRLEAVVRWTLTVQLAGEMPSLPSENSSLRSALAVNTEYTDLLMTISERLGEWIVAAQSAGALSRHLPPIAVLYTLFAKACDPVLQFLKATGQYGDDQIVDLVMDTCFNGLKAR